MYRVELSKTVIHLMSIFYFLGVWHRQDAATANQTVVKLFFLIYYSLFPISLIAGAITSVDIADSILLIECFIITVVMAVKFLFIIWKKKQIIEILNRCGTLAIDNPEDFNRVNNTLNRFEKFTIVLLVVSTLFTIFVSFIFLCLGGERKIFFNVAFPLDWKNDLFAYWIVNIFTFTETMFCVVTLFFSVIMWYSLINCTLMYEVLGNRIKNICSNANGKRINANKSKPLEMEKRIFIQDLTSTIDSFQYIRE